MRRMIFEIFIVKAYLWINHPEMVLIKNAKWRNGLMDF